MQAVSTGGVAEASATAVAEATAEVYVKATAEALALVDDSCTVAEATGGAAGEAEGNTYEDT